MVGLYWILPWTNFFVVVLSYLVVFQDWIVNGGPLLRLRLASAVTFDSHSSAFELTKGQRSILCFLMTICNVHVKPNWIKLWTFFRIKIIPRIIQYRPFWCYILWIRLTHQTIKLIDDLFLSDLLFLLYSFFKHFLDIDRILLFLFFTNRYKYSMQQIISLLMNFSYTGIFRTINDKELIDIFVNMLSVYVYLFFFEFARFDDAIQHLLKTWFFLNN